MVSRRSAIALVALAIGATLLYESDAVARRMAVQRAHDVLEGCAEVEGLDVDLGSFPVAVRAVRGHLDDVAVTADAVDLDAIRLRDLRGNVKRVRFDLLGGFDDIEIERASVSASVPQTDITRLLRDLDVPGDAIIRDGSLGIRLVGSTSPIELDIHADDDGSVVIGLEEPLASLLALRLAIPGVHVTRIVAAAESLHIAATFAGQPRAVACDAGKAISTRLRPLRALARLWPG